MTKSAEKKTYGKTRTGRLITDDLIQDAGEQAEEGFDVDEILQRRAGRPPMGSGPASVESVRLDPELNEALRQQAEREGRTNSEVIRDALRWYLKAR
jgi:Arc/MetJ-type ribon-helix-helix transcriptional regulator